MIKGNRLVITRMSNEIVDVSGKIVEQMVPQFNGFIEILKMLNSSIVVKSRKRTSPEMRTE